MAIIIPIMGDDAMSISEDYMSAVDAALALKIDRSRVLVLCRQGRLFGAEKIGTSWVIPRSSVENFRRLPPGGSKNLKQQHEEDKAMIARLRESTRQHGNAGVENCGHSEG